MIRARLVRDLRELIAALDSRLPQVHRPGEASIARDAADLKARALRRIAELEDPHSPGQPVVAAAREDQPAR